MKTLTVGRIEVREIYTKEGAYIAVDLMGDSGHIVATVWIEDRPKSNKFVIQVNSGLPVEFRLEVGGT